MEKINKNTEVVNTAQYGYAILKDNSRCPAAVISKKVFDVKKNSLNKAKVLTRWFMYLDKIFLSIYWPMEKKGLIFPFDGKKEKFIQSIKRKKALAISNSIENNRILIIKIPKSSD